MIFALREGVYFLKWYMCVLESFLRNLKVQYSYFYESLQLAKFTMLPAKKTNRCWFPNQTPGWISEKIADIWDRWLANQFINSPNIYKLLKIQWNNLEFDQDSILFSLSLSLFVSLSLHCNVILSVCRPLLKVWSRDLRHRHYGSFLEVQNAEILNRDLQFNQNPQLFSCIVIFETQCSLG